MPTEPDPLAVAEPGIQQLYPQLRQALSSLGAFTEQKKKTSIHLVRKSAFAGIAARKHWLVITLKASHAIDSPRILKAEQASTRRWYHDVKVASTSDIDPQLIAWLADSYALSE